MAGRAAGLIPPDYPITINAVSGYSGGGRSLIAAFESGDAPSFELYGLSLEHKHLPETQAYAKLARRPILVPSVGNFRQGMLVSVPLHLHTLPGKPSARDLEAVLARRYEACPLVRSFKRRWREHIVVKQITPCAEARPWRGSMDCLSIPSMKRQS